MRKSSLLVLLLLVVATASLPIACEWNAPDGTLYDFTSLHRSEGYKLKDASNTMGMFDILYILNVCETVKCAGNDVTLYEGLEILGEVTSNCDIITRATPPEYSFLNQNDFKQGVQWKFSGDLCQLPPTISYDGEGNIVTKANISKDLRTATVEIMCAEQESETFIVDSTDNCNLKFRMQSPTGCVGSAGSSHTFLKILLAIIIVFGVYFGVGSALNTRNYGITGIESIPHYTFWKEVPSHLNVGMKVTFAKLTQLVRNATSGASSSKSLPGQYLVV